MTATPIAPNDVGGDADILSHMFGLLVSDRTPEQASELLALAQDKIDEAKQAMQLQQDLRNRVSAVIIFLEQGLPPDTTTALRPRQRTMLEQAVVVCQEIIGTSGFGEYWRFIAAALQAECAHVLGDYRQALAYAGKALVLLPFATPTRPTIEHLAAYVKHLLSGRRPLPVTSHGFLDQLHRELLSM